MAEKKVSVRLVAEGGRRVKAEFQGIGDAGEQNFRRIERQAAVTGAVVRRVMGILGAAISTRQLVAYADQWTDLRSRVDLATGSQEAGAAVMERLAAMARRTYSSLGQTAESWLANATALRELGLSTAQSLDFTEALNNAMVVSGARAERAASVQTALSRAMALGRLSGDNLNTVIQNGGRLAELLAAELGTTVSGLRGLGQQGLITGEVIRKALLGNLELLRAEADSMPATIGDAFTLIGNAALRLVGTWDQMVGASATVAGALILVADNLERLAAIGIAFAGFMAARWVAGMAAAALSVGGLSTALVVLRGALIRTGIGALIVGAGELIYQVSQLVARVGGLGAAFRLLGDLAREVWSRMGLALDSALARMAAGWEGLKAAGLSALEGTIAGVVSFGDRTAAIFQGAYDAAVAIWGSLPGAIGDFAFQAANGLISGVEAMLNAVVTRINRFIEGLNGALALLPDWAVGEGGVRIGTLDALELGRIGNPFEGAATAAGTAAAEAFSTALAGTYLTAPDLGLGAMADEARTAAAGYREAAGMLADAAGRPLASWQALKDAVTGAGSEGEDALGRAADAADALADGFDEAGRAAGGAGAAAKKAAEEAAAGWAQVVQSLAEYAKGAMDWGKGLGETLVSAFTSAESAFRKFVTTGKFDFKGLIASILADLATLAFRTSVLGPLASWLSKGLGGIFAPVKHAGGMVGAPGPGRMVPALAFAGAPRMHSGGWAGLRPDEVPAILQRGERVLSRAEVAAGMGRGAGGAAGVTISIDARGAQAGVAEQIDAKLRVAIPEIARLAKASVADGRRRGHAL